MVVFLGGADGGDVNALTGVSSTPTFFVFTVSFVVDLSFMVMTVTQSKEKASML